MGLGALPGSDPQFVGMLGMHGTYEANMAMHQCDVMVCAGARFDDGLQVVWMHFRQIRKFRKILTLPRSTKTSVSMCQSWECRYHHPTDGESWKRLRNAAPTAKLSAPGGNRSKNGGRSTVAYSQDDKTIKPQYAIERLYDDEETRHLYHHRGRPTSDVGRAVL